MAYTIRIIKNDQEVALKRVYDSDSDKTIIPQIGSSIRVYQYMNKTNYIDGKVIDVLYVYNGTFMNDVDINIYIKDVINRIQ